MQHFEVGDEQRETENISQYVFVLKVQCYPFIKCFHLPQLPQFLSKILYLERQKHLKRLLYLFSIYIARSFTKVILGGE